MIFIFAEFLRGLKIEHNFSPKNLAKLNIESRKYINSIIRIIDVWLGSLNNIQTSDETMLKIFFKNRKIKGGIFVLYNNGQCDKDFCHKL